MLRRGLDERDENIAGHQVRVAGLPQGKHVPPGGIPLGPIGIVRDRRTSGVAVKVIDRAGNSVAHLSNHLDEARLPRARGPLHDGTIEAGATPGVQRAVVGPIRGYICLPDEGLRWVFESEDALRPAVPI